MLISKMKALSQKEFYYMKVNIYDVAEKAGVSITTVSRVMNNNGRVSQQTIEKVNKIIEELGYHPNMFAKGLANRKTNIIGILLPSFSDYTYSEIFTLELLKGIQKIARAHEFNMLIVNHQEDHQLLESPEYMKLIDGDKIDGLIAFEGMIKKDYLKKIVKRNFPVVLIGDYDDEENIKHTRLNEKEFYLKGLTSLQENGHNDICIIHYSEPYNNEKRKQFFREIFEELGLPFDVKINLLNGEYGNKDLREQIQEQVVLNRITTYFTDCIDYAGLVIDITRILDKTIAEDISVLTLEHIEYETDILYPDVNSILLSGSAIGDDAIRKMLQSLSIKIDEAEKVCVKIVDNASVKKII